MIIDLKDCSQEYLTFEVREGDKRKVVSVPFKELHENGLGKLIELIKHKFEPFN